MVRTSIQLHNEGADLNGWGSPNGFSVQTFDVYIDKDLALARQPMLRGECRAQERNGWDVAVWVEGWTRRWSSVNPMAEPLKIPKPHHDGYVNQVRTDCQRASGILRRGQP